MNSIKLTLVISTCLLLQGCLLTKVVTVPMRLGGALISIVPAAGNATHDAIDTAADAVDEIPI